MKRDLSLILLDLDDQPIRAGVSPEGVAKAVLSIWPTLPADIQERLNAAADKEAGKPLTLAAVCCGALIGKYPDEPNLGDDECIARIELARKLHAGGIVDIEPNERDRIKALIKKKYSDPLIRVVASELLEQDAAEPLKLAK